MLVLIHGARFNNQDDGRCLSHGLRSMQAAELLYGPFYSLRLCHVLAHISIVVLVILHYSVSLICVCGLRGQDGGMHPYIFIVLTYDQVAECHVLVGFGEDLQAYGALSGKFAFVASCCTQQKLEGQLQQCEPPTMPTDIEFGNA